MFYIVYKITNKINNKEYIGCHKTNNLDDGYMGSGKYLKRAIEKYGSENFTKEILKFFDTSDEMFAHEKELVTEKYVKSKMTYNLKEGGVGGWDYVNSEEFFNSSHTIEHMKMMSNVGQEARVSKLKWLRENDQEWFDNAKGKMSESHRRHVESKNYVNGFKNKTHSEEFKVRMRGHTNQTGKKNSQYGKPKKQSTIEKIQKTLSGKPLIVCPHCGVSSINNGSMLRWHFDNCILLKLSECK